MANNPQPATPQDLHSILSLFTTSFSSAYFQTLFPPTPAGRAYLAESWASFLSDTSPGKIYVIREGTGRVIAFALYFDEGGIVEYTTRWPKFDRFGLDGERLRAFFEGMDEQHRAAMGDGDHVYLELIMTSPEHQRQGLASKLIQHVVDVAGDNRPIYLDSQGHAIELYEKFGFARADSAISRTSELMEPMVRPGQKS